MMGLYVFFKILKYLVTICSDSASYFLDMSILIILVGTLTQIRMGLGCITFLGIGPRRVSMLPHVKIQNVNTFSTVNYCFGFSASYFLEMVMPIR